MQGAIVAVIVACAAWVVVRRYAPAPLRRAARAGTAGLGRRLGWGWLERRFSAENAAPATSACGSCGGCAGKRPPVLKPAAGRGVKPPSA